MRGYTPRQFVADLIAGLIVGVVAVPLSIAVAVASGVTPQQGLATAVVAGAAVAFFGGGRVQISGPTGTFIVVAYAIGAQYGYDGLALATAMAGIMLAIMGIARLGRVIQYVPYPVVIGFSSGIGTAILISQIGDLLGMSLVGAPPDVPARIVTYLGALGQINPADTVVALVTILIVVFWKHISKRVPGALVAILVVTIPVVAFDLSVVTINSRFGGLPRGMTWYGLPPVSLELIQQLLMPAFTIALLCGIESLFTAVVADGMVGDRHDPNTELVGEGIANIACAIFGGIPASGAIARTATNAKNGGRTPVAALANVALVLLVMTVLAPLAGFIPIAALAGVLAVVAYNMSEWGAFKALLKGPKSDVSVMLTTFALTILIDLSVAIQAGMVLAAFLFMHRMSVVSKIEVFGAEKKDRDRDRSGSAETDAARLEDIEIPDGVEVYEVSGPFFFGAAEKFRNVMLFIERRPKVRIVRMGAVGAIDATGLRLIEDLLADSKRFDMHLILCELQPQPERALKKTGLYESLQPGHIYDNLQEALEHAREYSEEKNENRGRIPPQ